MPFNATYVSDATSPPAPTSDNNSRPQKETLGKAQVGKPLSHTSSPHWVFRLATSVVSAKW
ncbi:hypothetical protein FRC10_002887 [Ceratobasidium sp. 414]|nr:hypothetical protein FRC10_002887 [Ceratobasidium sp. 414]